MNSNYSSPSSQPMASRPPPDSKIALILSIANFLFCCIPFGAVSIYYAVKINSSIANDDIDGAYDADKKSKIWSLVGAISGIIAYVLFFVFIFLGAITGP